MKSVRVDFEQVPPVDLVIYRVGYDLNGTTVYPEPYHVDALESWLKRAYPLSDLKVLRRTHNYRGTSPTSDDVNAELKDLRKNSSFSQGDTRFYGMFLATSLGEVDGNATGIPSFVASGTTGVPGPNNIFYWWVAGDTYGDLQGGHELGHTFGLHHIVGVPNPASPNTECGGEGVNPADDNFPYATYPGGRI